MGLSSNARSSSGLPASWFGKIGISVFFGLILALGLIFAAFIGASFLETLVTYGWTETPAAVLSSSVEERRDEDEPFLVEVRYRYQWEGRSFTSNDYQKSTPSYADYGEAQAKVSELPAGSATVCYVNPRNPDEAVLRREGMWMGLFIFIPLIFVAVGGGGVYETWFRRDERSRPLGSGASTEKGRGFVKVLGVVFALVGGGMLFFWFLPTLAKAVGSARWTETPCTVISSRVKSHSDSDGTTYSVDIFYRYTVDGREFKSNRVGLFGGSSSGYRAKAEVVARYPAGSKAVCYVNPANPGEAVLKPGVGWSALLGLVPAFFLVVGVVMLSSGEKSGGQRSGAVVPQASDSVARRALKTKASPAMRLGGAIFFAVFWNGIMSVFLWNVIDDFRHGSPNWFLAVFLIPFVLVGVGAIGAIGYFLMALTNPRCRVQVSPGVLAPGQPFEVSWTFHGSLQRIQRLRIFLEGREEATYRRGTSSYTDRQVFARLAVAEITSWMEMGQGEARWRLPEGVMASFEAPNNKIVWSLKVHGEISYWPDVNDEYEVAVGPGSAK